MKAMEIDSSKWTDEMRQNAVRKLEELGYVDCDNDEQIGLLSISLYKTGYFALFDDVEANIGFRTNEEIEKITTYEQLMAMTKEDVK